MQENSLPGSSRGMKLAAKALVRPLDAVPATLFSGIWMSPSGTRARAFSDSSISASTGRNGLWPFCMRAPYSLSASFRARA